MLLGYWAPVAMGKRSLCSRAKDFEGRPDLSCSLIMRASTEPGEWGCWFTALLLGNGSRVTVKCNTKVSPGYDWTNTGLLNELKSHAGIVKGNQTTNFLPELPSSLWFSVRLLVFISCLKSVFIV